MNIVWSPEAIEDLASLRAYIAEDNPAAAQRVVLDLRDLTFMDCAGLHVVIAATNHAARAGAHLVLVRGPSQVDRLFTLTGSSGELEIGDVDPGEPPVQVLLQLAEHELAR